MRKNQRWWPYEAGSGCMQIWSVLGNIWKTNSASQKIRKYECYDQLHKEEKIRIAWRKIITNIFEIFMIGVRSGLMVSSREIQSLRSSFISWHTWFGTGTPFILTRIWRVVDFSRYGIRAWYQYYECLYLDQRKENCIRFKDDDHILKIPTVSFLRISIRECLINAKPFVTYDWNTKAFKITHSNCVQWLFIESIIPFSPVIFYLRQAKGPNRCYLI